MAEKVTFMKLKVDLECEKCYKKVKKLLSKFPQIRDQKFDEKQNIVFITVVCCSPEKIRDKLCCKGGGSIKSIEIVELPKPKPPEPEKKKKDGDKPKTAEPEKKSEPGKKDDKPKSDPPKEESKKKKEDEKSKAAPSPAPGPKVPDPVPGKSLVPTPVAVPVEVCGVPWYDGRPGGPYINEYGGPPLWYGGYYARPVYDSYGGGRPYYVSRCDQYFSEENATGCTIM